jgi:hypothetical protein
MCSFCTVRIVLRALAARHLRKLLPSQGTLHLLFHNHCSLFSKVSVPVCTPIRVSSSVFCHAAANAAG